MKKYMFCTLFILTSLVILLLPKDIMTKKQEIDYEILEEKAPLYVYYVNNNKIYGVPIECREENKYKLIELAFKYLTEKSNSVDEIYYTCLNLNTKLVSYEVRKNDIYLEVTNNFLEIKEGNVLFALAQVLYSYKELGFDEVYITNNGKIIEQMANVILYDGLDELPVNLDVSTLSHNTKTVKIVYYYKNQTKSFVNHIINFNEDELAFTLKKIIDFVNKEHNTDIKLIQFQKTAQFLTVDLSCKEEDEVIIKKILMNNLNINETNITFS